MNEFEVKEIIKKETAPLSGIGCAILLLYVLLGVGSYFFAEEIQSLRFRIQTVEAKK